MSAAPRTPPGAEKISRCACALATPHLRWKILGRRDLAAAVRRLQEAGKKVVFTNGCFDLLHVGHVRYLQAARRLGDALVIGVNSDTSVRRLKGPARPLTPERERAEILAALECVDYVTIFGAATPLSLIRAVQPDILVKGGDWPVEKIVGRAVVEARGGRVLSIPLVPGASTTGIVARIGARAGKAARAGS